MNERLAVIAALALCACGQPEAPPPADDTASVFSAAPTLHLQLPNRLQEISGLALSPDGRLFGHDDERAIVYEIDVSQGQLRGAFALGDPPETGDFEGLAITPDGDFWLTTSRGRLYRFREGGDGANVAFERFDTGLRDTCEVEGLAYLGSTESLILACKQNYADDMRDTIALYSWRAADGDAAMWRTIPEAVITAAAGVRSFRPSGVEIDPSTGRILLLSGRDAALAELSADGALIAARSLGPSHPQAEGMAVDADGALIIADEGGAGRALISRFGRLHD